jgi:NAD-reducing hydrogenase large subunit
LIDADPQTARAGVALRKFGQDAIEALAQERIHPSWIVAGGVNAPLTPAARDRILAGLPNARALASHTLEQFEGLLDRFAEEIGHFGSAATLYAGLVDRSGALDWYDGLLQFKDPAGGAIAKDIPAADYASVIGEASQRDSYLKSPYYKPLGFPGGEYRVGPLARLNVAERLGTPEADRKLAEFRQRFGPVVHGSFHYHYARLIELVYALEKMELLLADPVILDSHVRSHAAVNRLEGVGMIEAPRGVLIHHYKVDEKGAIRWVNLIVATGHNSLAMNRSVAEVARHFVHGAEIAEGMLNRVSAVVRAYDPCLSCSTHADGTLDLEVVLIGADGRVLDRRH